ncbi:Clavaminate synthase-like protein [Sistotremastrum suecicum HHB10207 ss-3]|uniref:Clavaminate synthase-like protein n=1 Tax=Sistotremastrum suecicum HHB10207 ss-3 TaxID=1314776 RepID=A0A166IJT6_9AGAM|nr:Clavaminate synthase-like protein [Sistotremastrum suecicum HHB10207 ss-3]
MASYPNIPFPDDVPTHPLFIVDFKLIEAKDPFELDKLRQASTNLGFWYLKNHGAEELVDKMFNIGEDMMDLPLDEKMKWEQGDSGRSFGYKCIGGNAVDEEGTPDAVEFLNLSKDDILSYPTPTHRTYPSLVNERMTSIVQPFLEISLHVTNVLIGALNDMLGLPAGTLAALHSKEPPSGSEIRIIKKSPQPGGTEEKAAALAAHTDFGSLSFLHNRMGGLQVLVPGNDVWQYIRPIPNHAVCNIGDALKIFSAGILRSNIHRVMHVSPPGEQRNYNRWSLVYFSRPSNQVLLRNLADKSSIIAEALKESEDKFVTDSNAGDWFARRIKNQRLKNRTGPETWRASRGTEFNPNLL